MFSILYGRSSIHDSFTGPSKEFSGIRCNGLKLKEVFSSCAMHCFNESHLSILCGTYMIHRENTGLYRINQIRSFLMNAIATNAF